MNNKNRKKRHTEKDQASVTPEHDFVDDKTVCKQQSSAKIIETPQMKAIREKMLKKLTAKDKPSPSSSKTSTKLAENKTVSSSKRISRFVKNDESISRDKNDNEVTTFTPQMSVFYEKIQRRNLNKSNSDKKLKINAKSKQQELNTTCQESVKIQEKQEKSTRYQGTVNQNNDIERCLNNKRQNVQKSYDQNISSN